MDRLFADAPVTLVRPGDLGLTIEVEEMGATFEANARLKAQAYLHATDLPTIGEDSGLEIDSLGGEPGVLSARYHGLPDGPVKNAHILDLLDGRPMAQRRCVYVCSMVLMEPGSGEHVFEGRCTGRIAREPAGTGGFGFDPIVEIARLHRTMAELTDEEKDLISHRGRAVRKLLGFLRRAGPV